MGGLLTATSVFVLLLYCVVSQNSVSTQSSRPLVLSNRSRTDPSCLAARISPTFRDTAKRTDKQREWGTVIVEQSNVVSLSCELILWVTSVNTVTFDRAASIVISVGRGAGDGRFSSSLNIVGYHRNNNTFGRMNKVVHPPRDRNVTSCRRASSA